MIDFSSALYLGFRHPAEALRPWKSLSSGKPALLEEPEGAQKLAQALAGLIGCEAGLLLPSTLHAFWDLFIVLAEEGIAIFMDSGVYPVVRWGIERAKAHGIKVQGFPHHDHLTLKAMLKKQTHILKPVIVTDGFCPACGKPAPLQAYHEIVREYKGYLVIDDTQAFGILGEKKGNYLPYGRGGGGTIRWKGLISKDLIVVSSLAKGFGVPVTILSGTYAFIENFKNKSKTRIHCSPPSIAVIRAAEHALKLNREYGDSLRLHLARLVKYFKKRIKEKGSDTIGGLFPVQTLIVNHGINVIHLYDFLVQSDIKTVLHRNREIANSKISFLIRADHSFYDIDKAVDVLSYAISIQVKNQSKEVSYEKYLYL